MTLIAQPEIKTLKDLKGKTLGISSFGATPDVAARMMIKQAGIDTERTSKCWPWAPTPPVSSALKKRVVDVVVVSPPADAQLEKQGYRILARAYELFSYPYLGLGTPPRKIKEKPDEIRRVMKAAIRANRFIRDNRDESVRALMAGVKSNVSSPMLPTMLSESIQHRRRRAGGRFQAGYRAGKAKRESHARSRRP